MCFGTTMTDLIDLFIELKVKFGNIDSYAFFLTQQTEYTYTF
jgi:hypothetical protein